MVEWLICILDRFFVFIFEFNTSRAKDMSATASSIHFQIFLLQDYFISITHWSTL